MSTTKRTVYTAMCVALAVILPLAFHTIPNAGSILLPMHIPVLLCGLICGWPYGLLCGGLSPLLSNLITGMPPMAFLPAMVFELAAYGMAAGLLIRFVKSKNRLVNIYAALIGSMVVGRIVSGIVKALIFNVGKFSMTLWISSSFATALPGIIIQLAIIPILVLGLQRAKLIEPVK